MSTSADIRQLALCALAACEPTSKLAAMAALKALRDVSPRLCFDAIDADPMRGEFAAPPRVAPGALPRRNPGQVAGRAALIHAIAHIEYSAIDLALDHALRFGGMPAAYYADWLDVASEEAYHFELLRGHLLTLGSDYGDFPVHDGLWQMAQKTAGDVLVRMAMVPRLLEARGLDATPPIQRKLAAAGDTDAVRLLDIILADEEGHVRLGDTWYRHLCAERGVDAEPLFRQLIDQYKGPWPQTPMNESARLAAGFSRVELDELTARQRTR